MICPYNGVLFNNEREWSINTNLLEPEGIMLSENSQTKIEFLEMKAALSEMRNTVGGIRHRIIFLGQNWLVVYLLKA